MDRSLRSTFLVVLAGVSTLGIVACGADTDSSTEDQNADTLAIDGPVIAYAQRPSADRTILQASIGGRLHIRGDCLRIGRSQAVWPHGTSWLAEDQVVRLPDGHVARDGDFVTGGGGSFSVSKDDAGAIDGLCAKPRARFAWFNNGEGISVVAGGTVD